MEAACVCKHARARTFQWETQGTMKSFHCVSHALSSHNKCHTLEHKQCSPILGRLLTDLGPCEQPGAFMGGGGEFAFIGCCSSSDPKLQRWVWELYFASPIDLHVAIFHTPSVLLASAGAAIQVMTDTD